MILSATMAFGTVPAPALAEMAQLPAAAQGEGDAPSPGQGTSEGSGDAGASGQGVTSDAEGGQPVGGGPDEGAPSAEEGERDSGGNPDAGAPSGTPEEPDTNGADTPDGRALPAEGDSTPAAPLGGETPASEEAATALRAESAPATFASPGGPDDEGLLDSYARGRLDAALPQQVPPGSPNSRAGDQLQGVDRAAYEALAAEVAEIAAGRRGSGVVALSLASLTDDLGPWTAADLGVTAIAENGAITGEAVAAAAARLTPDLEAVIGALLTDCPYEMYWYDRGAGTSAAPLSLTASGSGGEWTLSCESAEVELSMSVRADCSLTGTAGTTDVNTSLGQSVSTAVTRAQRIVSDNDGRPAADRLRAYADAICESAAYGGDAAESGVPNRDPWQVVWALDEEPDTVVASEGYAGAFKYLCDLTWPGGEGVSCLLARGTWDGGGARGHTWNVVRTGDGRTLLVDVAACDGGATAGPDGLFLAGAAGGSCDEGFSFEAGGASVRYAYGEETRGAYGEEALAVSEAGAAAQARGGRADATKGGPTTAGGGAGGPEAGPTAIGIPAAAGGLVYEGTERAGVAAGEGYGLSGTASATEAGEYTATATLVDGYAWSDGTIDPKEIPWSIARRTVTVTADDKEKVAGTADPELTATVEGLVGDDSVTYTISREAGEGPGGYEVTPAGEAEQGNYAVGYVPGRLSVLEIGPSVVGDAVARVVSECAASGQDACAVDAGSCASVADGGKVVDAGRSAQSLRLSAESLGRTCDEAMSWVQSQLGQCLTQPNGVGGQCVDLVGCYLNYLGTDIIWGNAGDYTYASLPAGVTRIQGAQPQRGDILVWTNDSVGHVAIYESDYVTYHQNWLYQEKVLVETRYRYDNAVFGSYWGVIRPDFKSSAPPAYSDFHVGEIQDSQFTVMAKVTDSDGISSVRYAVWTEENGQDDIVWYDAHCTDNNDVFWAHVPFSDHGNSKGKYVIHMYAYDSSGNKANPGIEYRFDTNGPTVEDFHAGELNAERFTVMAKITDPNGVASVRYAVWTEENGQDDIVWYDGHCTDNNDVYWAWVPFADHNGERGNYIIHLYAYDPGGKLTNPGITYRVGSEPEGCFDTAVGGDGTVYVKGWALDRDEPNKSVEVHVYVGGGLIDGEAHSGVTANLPYPSVNEATGVAGDHGFEATLSTDRRGNVEVYAYAIDPQGQGNQQLSGVCRTTVLEPARNATSVEQGPYAVRSKADTSKGLDVNGGSTDDLANVMLCSWNGGDNQVFAINAAGDGSYFMVAKHSSKAVEVTNGAVASGANVAQYGQNQSVAQRWFFDKNDDGTYTIRQRQSGLVMDVWGGAAVDGANIAQGVANGGDNQRFYLVPIDAARWSVTVSDQQFTGGQLTPIPTVKAGGVTLRKDVDYTVSYESNVDVGTATATITAHNGYSGSTAATFRIVASGQWVRLGSSWYWYGADGEPAHGWAKVGGSWYYLDPSSGALRSGWLRDGGSWYYLDPADGSRMATGWRKVGGSWYLFAGGQMRTGWAKDGGSWYYLDPANDSRMATGWARVGSWWYLFAGGGQMLSGWQRSGSSWYYLDPANDSRMATGWCKVGSWWYLLAGGGQMLSGWQKSGGRWYYLDPANDSRMATGWRQVGGRWYYLDSSGAMATGRRQIGGKWYEFASSGEWVA